MPVSTAAYNAANELTQWGTATLTYDLNGNMLSDGTNSFVWNARNQLASMNASTISFKYGAFGRRVSKTISGATTSFLYDGINPLQELSGTTVTANLLTGLGVDEHFLRTDSAGARNFLTDPLGSTVALADSTGTVQTSYAGVYPERSRREPFGNTTVTGQASANSYQYTGREDDGTGLYFYRARYYNPMFGRFMSQDPIGFAGGINPYAYAGDGPTDGTDPTGLWLGYDHRSITREAIRKANWPGDPEALAKAVADVDTGTQGTDPYDTNTHAMAGRKGKKWQTCEDAYSGTKQQIANDVQSGALDKAIHTIEDAWDPYHMGYPRWHGVWDAFQSGPHLVGDFIAPKKNHGDYYTAAVDYTAQFLRDLQNGTFSDPAKYLPTDPCRQ